MLRKLLGVLLILLVAGGAFRERMQTSLRNHEFIEYGINGGSGEYDAAGNDAFLKGFLPVIIGGGAIYYYISKSKKKEEKDNKEAIDNENQE